MPRVTLDACVGAQVVYAHKHVCVCMGGGFHFTNNGELNALISASKDYFSIAKTHVD